jgi:hypothetical protein
MNYRKITVLMDEEDCMKLIAYKRYSAEFSKRTPTDEELKLRGKLLTQAQAVVDGHFWDLTHGAQKEAQERLVNESVDVYLEEIDTSEENEEGGS